MLEFAQAPSHLSDLTPRLERICNKHCSLGVEPSQYPLVGKYLLSAFASILGSAWTPEIEGAWAKAYGLLSNMFIGREAQLYREFGSWKGFPFMRIVRKVTEGDDAVCSFYLERLDGEPLPTFVPGQYVSVRVEVPSIGYLQARQYSLSDAPGAKYYRITVRRNQGLLRDSGCPVKSPPGLVSNVLLDRFEVGSLVGVSHPAGGFGFDPSPYNASPLVLVSAGSGVTPLMSIFNSVMSGLGGSRRPVSWVHFDAATSAKLPFEDEIKAVASVRHTVQAKFLRGCAFAEEEDQREWKIRAESLRVELGKLDPDLMHFDKSGAEYYLCGPTRFVRHVSAFLRDTGVMEDRIRTEWFATGSLNMTA
ncbi:hypothetical protein GMORB2_3389 [Geosmithia morbida]|uniref:nitric oxide dioxygenase n=1 Tax=Geosmithia morbida TaxID=1094350 RepID=A0A9P4YN19_9HYPO|nr:uncharacterized protein GMORB2_3389 [Geosmithia morbida]KAF4119978.1 hypothetical protein GMORB2_3389 [Geosmithia morbida]